MKNLIVGAMLAGSLLLAGCKKEPYIVKSILKVDHPLEVKDDNSEVVNLNAGDYPTDLNINSSRVKVRVETANKKHTTFRLKLPKNTKLPTNGELVLTSKESGQPFDTRVIVSTEIENSRRYRDHESCTVHDYYTECFVTGRPPRTVCQRVPRTRWGHRPIEYYVRTYNRQILAQLRSENGQADVEGSRVDSERIYTYEGMCF